MADDHAAGDIRDTANDLRRLVDQVTPEEFSWQEANYSVDSELGRELVYLIANNEWVRATSEVIDVTRGNAIATTVRIDVDLDRITHEAFRHRTGRLWLPVFVLPPSLNGDGQRWPEPDPFGTMTVSNASGELLPTLPGAEVRHSISAALAEIIVNMAATRVPKMAGTWPAATRDHRLLLSAAIYRLLRHVPPDQPAQADPARDQHRGTAPGISRLNRARLELGALLSLYADSASGPGPLDAGGIPAGTHQQDDAATVRMLTARAVMVLQAFVESAIVVVAVRRDRTPAVLTLKLPSRSMSQKRRERWRPRDPETGTWSRPSTWSWLNWRTWNWLLPRAQLDIDLLLPSADADRQVRVDLPEQISFDPSRPPAELEISVTQPPPFEHLGQLMSQLLDEQEDRPVALQKSIADVAAAMADAARESMRDHLVAPVSGAAGSPPPGAGNDPLTLAEKLLELRQRLELPSDPDAHADARRKLAEAWSAGDWLRKPLRRRTSSDLLSPETVVAKASMIEDVSRRGAPTSARIQVHVAVTDAEYFSIARFSSRMSGLLMTVVLGFFGVTALLGWKNSEVSAEVLAFVLTLFSAIQAGRIEHSDRSTLHGLLSGSGSFLIVAAVLPSVLLAVALAFSRTGLWPIGWAAGAIGLQLVIERLMTIRLSWEHGLRSSDRPIAGGLLLYSDPLNYDHAEILHSGWWRGATANALLIGQPAYGYMIWQRDSSATLRELLRGASPAKAEPAAQPLLPQTGTRIQDSARDDDLSSGPEIPLSGDLPSGDLREAVPEDASVLALQRSGTAGQSVTFVVFREEPEESWVSKSRAIAVKLDPDELAPITDGIASVEIFAGLPRDQCLLPVAEHPLTGILGVTADYRLFVLDAQLPVPAPAPGYSDLLWGRVRVTLHDTEIRLLGELLDAIRQRTIGGTPVGSDGQLPNDGLVMAVRTVPDGPLQILNSRPRARLANDDLVLASHMDIMTAGPQPAEGPDEKAWRTTAICADARTGVESAIMQSLDSGLHLAGLTYALLYGKAVFIAVGHQSGGQAEPERLSDRLADGRAGANARAYLDERQSRNDLGLAPPEPVLRVHVRLPDRAGMTLAVLDSLAGMLPALAPGGLKPVTWQIWYARVQVIDGNTALIMLTARLAVAPLVAAGWGQSVFEDLARQARRKAMSRAAGTVRQTGSGFRASEDTALSVRLITTPNFDFVDLTD